MVDKAGILIYTIYKQVNYIGNEMAYKAKYLRDVIETQCHILFNVELVNVPNRSAGGLLYSS